MNRNNEKTLKWERKPNMGMDKKIYIYSICILN